jgi:two-component system sensor kinase FixL
MALALLVALQLAAPPESGVTPKPRVAERRADESRAGGASAPRVPPESKVGRQPKRVLALYWYGPDHPVTMAFDHQFQSVLKGQGGGDVVRYAEYLEPGSLPGDQQERIVRDYLSRKYADRKIDVLFAWGAGSVEFLLKHHHVLFPDAPIVYYASSLDAIKHIPAPPLTGVVNPDAYERTLELALSLHPDATDAYVVSATANRDKSIEREAASQLARFQGKVRISYLTDLPLDELIAAVRNVPRRSVILYSRQSHEDPGRALQPFDFLDPISRAASVPIYAPWRSHVGSGSVGGIVDNPVAGATKAAQLVLRVARGARPEDVPLERVPKSPLFDARQLTRFGISESRLPAGSVVLFREPTIWTRYRSYIIGTGVVVALQTLLIAGLLVQRARRRRVEAALRESEERFRVMADTAPVMIWRSTTTGDCDFFNLPWLAFRGRSLHEEAGSGWAQGVHPDDRDQCLSTYESAFKARRSFFMEYRLLRADGEYRWVMDTGIPRFEPDGAFAGYIGSCFDITERKLAEEALRASENRYALATASGAVGVWDWNLATSEIYIDPAIRRTLGFADRDVDSHLDSWDMVLPPEDADRLQADAQACVDGRKCFFENEHRLVQRDGSIRWFLIRGSAGRQDEAPATRITGTVTDITERKRAEANLEETRDELARMARVTSLAQSAASIAHELSQPLASIQMNIGACLRWLGGTGVPTDELHGALRDIAEAAALANGVVTRDKEQFRRHAVEKQALDANGVIAEVASLVRTRLQQSGVTLDMKLGDKLPPVLGDRVELQQVLLNLMLNGIEAMETVDAQSRRLTIETRLTGALVQTTVRDTGTGIRDADAGRLFTPFYTTKSRGTGIGLSISKFIIERHGGRLWAERSNGLGATFCFTVPVATAEATTGTRSGMEAKRGRQEDEAMPGTLAS